MADSPNVDEQPTTRRSIRSCRLSIVKPKPSIEKEAEEPIPDEDEVEEEDPPDLFQVGDIFWVRVAGNPYWPALIYGSYYEDNIHTKVVKYGRRAKKRVYFVYFYGPSFEYTWTPATLLVPYGGLEEFMQFVEAAVKNAGSKTEQEVIANRYELRVSAHKRAHWDQAIEEANEAIKLPREERIKNFEEILTSILEKAEKSKSKKRRHTSVTTGPSRKTLSPPGNKSTHRSSVKRQKTNVTPVSTSTTLLHVGLPTLTKMEEKRLVNDLLAHPKDASLTLSEAQSFACQLAMDIVKENSHYEMSCVQIEWFYDFLIRHPDIVSKYSQWFSDEIKPITDDAIYVKQCQLRNMIVSSKN